MAQWKPGPFDIVYDDKINANLRLLRSAADQWASRGAAALAVDEVLAVLLHVFARPWSDYNHPHDRKEKVLPLGEWRALVNEPWQECAALRPLCRSQQVDAALFDLRMLLDRAVQSWSAGSPEDPPTDMVLRDVAQTLFRHRFLHRPPPAKIDDCFGSA